MPENENLRARVFREVLPFVQKPARYAGGELNAVHKDRSGLRARMALCFPDLYEIGASNNGFTILYHVVNADPRFAAERAYMADFDMRARLTRTGIPLYALESFSPLSGFDVLGFTLQYELSYPNIPAMLALAGIPVLSADRGDAHPLVMAGGPLSVNPMPLADIVDAFVLGDGEEAVILCLAAVSENKGRMARLKALSEIEGVYVPLFPPLKGFSRARIAELSEAHYPEKPLVPLMAPVHDRYALEVMRGCPHGCRYCSAGFYYRPARERDGRAVIERLRGAVREQGWRDVSLLSLSTADYGPLPAVVRAGLPLTRDGIVQLSLPSTRLDKVTASLLHALDRGRRTGITFAPEAGSERLRRVINKGLTEAEILDNIQMALESGFDVVKLYFMTGLPTETPEDIDALIALVHKIKDLFAGLAGRRQLNVSVSPFCPKPGTPFEREALLPVAEIRRRGEFIKEAVRGRGTSAHWSAGETARMETVLSRAGRELGPVLVRAAEQGLLLQSWDEHFNDEKWMALLTDAGLSAENYTGSIPAEKPLPWRFLRSDADAAFLAEEREKAMRAELTDDCGEACGHPCGACEGPARVRLAAALPLETAEPADAPVPTSQKRVYLFTYVKDGIARFVPHRDLMRLLERAFRAAGLRLEYSQGFSAHPRLSLFYPLSLGFSGSAELFQAALLQELDADALGRLNAGLPQGLRVLSASPFNGKIAVERVVTGAVYRVRGLGNLSGIVQNVEPFLASESWMALRENKDSKKAMNIRPLVQAWTPGNGELTVTLSLGDKGSLKPRDFLVLVAGLSPDAVLALDIERQYLIFPEGLLHGYPPGHSEGAAP